MSTVACACNVYNDALALPGMLENAAQWADEIFIIHAGPGGKASNDGTMEILEKWQIKPIMADIMVGFGVIRTRLIHECKCDWAIITDSDERLLINGRVLRCVGEDQFPSTMQPKNRVDIIDHSFCHWRWLKGVIDGAGDDYDAIRMMRRAWMDMGMRIPAQSWVKHPDHQIRCVKNNGHIGYTSDVRMHERIVDFRTGGTPRLFQIDDPDRNFYFEHFHPFFKARELAQNQEDLEIYEQLSPGVTQHMWLSHQPKA